MPEIKHHFTGGKMNKDLDERLIPNGEYRDAMNIQVSTSEESDVGTIQNILGNSLVPGQSFIGEGAFCVGSIADEKNDKLYYFVTENKNLIRNGNFDFSGDEWLLNSTTISNVFSGWEWVGKSFRSMRATNAGLYFKINQNLEDNIYVKDVFYEIKFKVSNYVKGNIAATLYNEIGEGFYIGKTLMSGDGDYTFTRQVGSITPLATLPSSFASRFYIQSVNPPGGGTFVSFTGDIDNVSIKRIGNYIIEYDSKTNNITPVLIDTKGSVLNFSADRLITGINIIDDMLFFTDNHSEPKKINIPRSIQGTDPSGLIHTNFINEKTNLEVPIEEKHITVIKEKPSLAPAITLINPRLETENYSGLMTITTDPGTGTNNSSFINPLDAYDFSDFNQSSVFTFKLDTDLNNNTNFDLSWSVGDIIYFEPFSGANYEEAPGIPLTNYSVKAKVISSTSIASGGYEVVCEISAIPEYIPVPSGFNELKFVVDKFFNYEKIFEFKFPRIAYRYKYQDGEHSVISPFSQVIFKPGAFNYHPKEGYNTGMVNTAQAIQVSRYMDNIPDGVSEIDILYKDDASTEIYIVDTIMPGHTAVTGSTNYWNSNLYTIESEQVNRAIESNQILRPYDNVPKKALAQEVSGSRIIYGNYTQGYDLKTTDSDEDYYPNFSVENKDEGIPSQGVPSIKSIREYQIGAVFVDKYGRETPVVSNKTGINAIGKDMAPNINQFEVSFLDTDPPKDLEYFKFFIKETSGEYYNMAMDRYYDAEDENLWLSFPSSDINKVAIDDFIILKKGLGSDTLVSDEARYKILDIQTEAPEFIKIKKFLSEEIEHVATADETDLFGSLFSDNPPREGVRHFEARYEPFSIGSSARLHEIPAGQLHIQFVDAVTNQASDIYRVTSLSESEALPINGGTVAVDTINYNFQLEKRLGDDVNFITNDSTGVNSTKVENNIVLRTYNYVPQNSSQFDGRFFVKIHENANTYSNITSSYASDAAVKYRTVASRKVFSMRSDHRSKHSQIWTGMTLTSYADLTSSSASNTSKNSIKGFGAYASFFRNYDKPSNYGSIPAIGGAMLKKMASSSSPEVYVNVGQYAFGANVTPYYDGSGGNNVSTANWVEELAWITGGTQFERNYSTNFGSAANFKPSGSFMACTNNHLNSADAKRADDLGLGNNEDRELETGVWYLNNTPREGKFSNITGQPSTDLDFNKISKGYIGPGVPIRTNHPDNSTSRWQISLGGIFDQTTLKNYQNSTPDVNEIADFWSIGKSGGNNKYDSTATVAFVKGLSSSGYYLRWKEDPNANAYRVKNLQEHYGVLNFAADYDQGPGSSSSNAGTLDKNTFSIGGKGSGVYHLNTMETNNRHVTGQLSPNYSVTWMVNATNENGTGDVIWNPFDAGLGAITGGLELETTASSDGIIDSVVQIPKVTVASLQVTNTVDGKSYNIEPGMILTKYHGTTLENSGISKGELIVWKITTTASGDYTLYLTGYRRPLLNSVGATNMNSVPNVASNTYSAHTIYSSSTWVTSGQTLIFKQPRLNGYSQNSCNRINAQNNMGMPATGPYDYDGTYGTGQYPRIMPVSYTLQVLQDSTPEVEMPDNPAIWETEPKENTALDVYYEASGYNNIKLTQDNIDEVIPINSTARRNVEAALIDGFGYSTTVNPFVGSSGTGIFTPGSGPATLISATGTGTFGTPGFYIDLVSTTSFSGAISISGLIGSRLKIVKPDGSYVRVLVNGYEDIIQDSSTSVAYTNRIYIDENLYNAPYGLSWYNCFTFGNGVESNRIRDNFNLPFISNGVKASTTVPFPSLGEEHRKYGLIYSGLYNSISGVNNLNQFIAAEKITKEVNPIYGSIQKLHARDTDLVTLCEDKVLKILANKDAVFNADGNPQLTANQNVLGQTIPFVGEYGISKNPESFASESYRAYFTDRVRGTVMRLSMDGLTPISDHGMKDWFRDNLSLGSTNLLGENNLASQDNWNIPANGNSAVIDGVAILGYYNDQPTDPRFGKSARLKMNNVMEVGKTYRVRFEVIEHSNYTSSSGAYKGIVINNSFPGGGWTSAVLGMGNNYVGEIDATFVANRKEFELLQYQVNSANQPPVSGSGYSNILDASGNIIDSALQQWARAEGAPQYYGTYFYGGTVSIKNLILEEVKQDLKLIGSYDDKKDEYNISVHSNNATTVSFKESVKGWVSFKSFVPESALSCANDYFTIKEGKLWQHHNPGVSRNTFYNEFTNSSFNVMLNDLPSVIKSYHTLEYEGSKSRIEGLKSATVTGIEIGLGPSYDGQYGFFELEDMTRALGLEYPPVFPHATIHDIRQYRDGNLIYNGPAFLVGQLGSTSYALTSPSGGPTKGYLRKEPLSIASTEDFKVGDIITTKPQEDSVTYLNYFPRGGWFTSIIETDKEKGSLLEFLEKEGKWFNYIKGVDQPIDEETDYSSFDVQGLGVASAIDLNTYKMTLNTVNSSLQVGDVVYYQRPTTNLGEELVDFNTFTTITHIPSYNITSNTTIDWAATTNTPTGENYISDITINSLIPGETYFITLDIINYDKTGSGGEIGVSDSGGVGTNIRFDKDDVDAIGNGRIEKYFVADGDQIRVFAEDTVISATIQVSIKKATRGTVLGSEVINSDNLFKVGKVIEINKNVVSFSGGSTMPFANIDYCFFVKNQVVNMNGLGGYYAEAKFENNSKEKAELFTVSSEITESSK